MTAEGHNPRLVVFSDDWGRHPSSCQHLVGRLLPRYPTLWVNTIGTRRPGVSPGDLGKILVKLRQWVSPPDVGETLPANLMVVSPRMWPGFSRGWQRRFNARSISRAVNRVLGGRGGDLRSECKMAGGTPAPPEKNLGTGEEALTPPSPKLPPSKLAAGEGVEPESPSPGGHPRSVAATLSLTPGWRERGLRIAVTTLPITADLVGKLDVDRWVYYCVDDFTVWPGMDGDVMRAMERELVAKVDAVVAVSDVLRERLAAMGREAEVLTHGFDPEHWGWKSDQDPHLSARTPTSSPGGRGVSAPTVATQGQPARAGVGAAAAAELPEWWAGLDRPIFLFWGLIDQRLDVEWCARLVGAVDGPTGVTGDALTRRPGGRHPLPEGEGNKSGTLVLVGTQQSPDPRLADIKGLIMPGPVDYALLPVLAAATDVLVMPYADLPVTRAMQPLKLKEYLATGKPVVVRDLPATRAWSDAADVVSSAEAFVQVARKRARDGVPAEQLAARGRLASESWAIKAERFEAVLLGRT